ncbi:hypothetical protein PAT3040_03597 [Paenibacillus agaridevorans]|uniref:Uncharacterized protein n=1 Tax=Paenibacillus agaridevorans TaxID=171404 RepID=A0A2R5ETH3_9BACL|nr:hypothetical protein PAT3040_03597 [Paenibacillus agaridevorans]
MTPKALDCIKRCETLFLSNKKRSLLPEGTEEPWYHPNSNHVAYKTAVRDCSSPVNGGNRAALLTRNNIRPFKRMLRSELRQPVP